MSRRRRRWPGVTSARSLAVGVLLAAAIGLPPVALASQPPDPDSACASEATHKSIEATTRATLTILNHTDETVQAFWLDYTGARVFYEQIPPRSSFDQATWLTHPWVMASATGTCYRLVVVTAIRQTVSVDPGADGAPVVTAEPPLETFATSPSVAPAGAGPIGGADSGSGSAAGSGGGLPIVPAVVGVLALLALAGGLAASGRLPGASGVGEGATGTSGSASAGGPGSGRIPGAGKLVPKAVIEKLPALGKQLGDAVASAGGGPPISRDGPAFTPPSVESLRDAWDQAIADNVDLSVGIDPESPGLSIGVIGDQMHFDSSSSIRSRPFEGLSHALGRASAIGGELGTAIGGGGAPAPDPLQPSSGDLGQKAVEDSNTAPSDTPLEY